MAEFISGIIGIALGFLTPGFLLGVLLLRFRIGAIPRLVLSVAISLGFLQLSMLCLSLLGYTLTFSTVTIFLSVISAFIFVLSPLGRKSVSLLLAASITPESTTVPLQLKYIRSIKNILTAYSQEIKEIFYEQTIFQYLLHIKALKQEKGVLRALESVKSDFIGAAYKTFHNLWAEKKNIVPLVIISFVVFMIFLHTVTEPYLDLQDSLVLYGPQGRYIFENNSYPWSGETPYIPNFFQVRLTSIMAGWLYLSFNEENLVASTLAVTALGFLTLLMVIFMSYKLTGNRFQALMAGVALLIMPEFVRRSFSLHIDVPFTFMFIAAIYISTLSLTMKRPTVSMLSGLTIGSLVWSKVFGYVFPIVLLALMAKFLIFTKNDRQLIRSNAVQLLLIFLFIAPMLLGNTIKYSNPFYPFLTDTLGGDRLSASLIIDTDPAIQSAQEERSEGSYAYVRILDVLRLYPYLNQWKGESILFALVALLGLFGLSKNIRTTTNQLALGSILLLLLAWYYTGLGNRQLILIYALLCIYASKYFIFSKANFSGSNNNESQKKVAAAFLVTVLILTPIVASYVTVIKRPVEKFDFGEEYGLFIALAAKSKEGVADKSPLLFQNLDKSQADLIKKYHGKLSKVWGFINSKNIPQDAVIFSLDPNVYYIDRKVIWDKNPGVNQIYKQDDICEVLTILKRYGITHILYSALWKSLYPSLDTNILWNSLDKDSYFTKIYSLPKASVSVYEVRYAC